MCLGGLGRILGGSGKRRGEDEINGRSGRYTKKLILLCISETQRPKKSRDGMVGIHRRIQPWDEFMERTKNIG